MKKTLIAAAVAAAVAAPSANAGVVIYGKIHNSIDYVNNIATFTTKQWQVASRTSRIGFKGSEDLGNGLKAIWKVEASYDTANGGAWGGSSRNTYVGLSGDWGTFLVGRHDTPYKMAFYSTGIDMMGDTVADANTMYLFHEVRASNAIAYVSPNMNGLTIAAAIIPGENGAIGGNGLADAYSLGVMYKNNGLKAALGYEDLNLLGGFTKNSKVFAGVGYSMNGFDVALGYQSHDIGLVNNLKSWAIAGAYSFGNNKVIGTVGQAKFGTAKMQSYALGVEHKFSKRTKAYALYAVSENGISGTVSGGNGVPGTPITNLGLVNIGASPVSFKGKAFSLGMIHNF